MMTKDDPQIPLEALTSKFSAQPWHQNAGGPVHTPKRLEVDLWGNRDIIAYEVEAFIGTFAEQWTEVDVVLTIEWPDGDKVRSRRLAKFAPHKHGGDNLGGPNAAGDDKSVTLGGVYYDACFTRKIPYVLIPRGAKLVAQWSSAEMGRGVHLGIGIYGIDRGKLPGKA